MRFGHRNRVNDFRRPDFDRMKLLMKQPVIFDGRNIYDPHVMAERGSCITESAGAA